jgi:sodium-independent organic anion transporter
MARSSLRVNAPTTSADFNEGDEDMFRSPVPGGTAEPSRVQQDQHHPVLSSTLMSINAGATRRLGVGRWSPDWLQRFATPGGFVFAVSLFTVVQSMVNSGLFPVIVSSIERRFGFSSTQAGVILSSYDMVSAVLVVLVTHFAHSAHRPRWLARGMCGLGVGCVLATASHWLSGPYSPSSLGADTNLCVGQADTSCESGDARFFGLFVLAQVVIAAACAPLYPLGSTYIDDNARPRDHGKYMGIFYAMGAVGPAIGFVVGGLFLRVWVDPSTSPPVSQDSVAWVGAWWAPFLLAGGLAFTLALPLALFPRALPGSEHVAEERMHAADRAPSASPSPASSPAASDANCNKDPPKYTILMSAPEGKRLATQSERGSSGDAAAGRHTLGKVSFVRAVRSILATKPFLFTQLGFTLEAVVVIGVGNFLPKIVQTQFRTTAANASFSSGAAIVAGAAGGILVGGLVSRKWSMQVTARNVFILAMIALFTIPCFLIRCDTIQLAGLTANYPDWSPGSMHFAHPTLAPIPNTTLTAACNLGCDCRAASFSPVCADGVTYFSACHAGCTEQAGTHSFTNCSCLSRPAQVAAAGTCQGTCDRAAYFLLALFVLMFVTFMINVPATVFCMRVVADSERSLALGLGSALQRVGGSIPGPLLVGAMLDSACLLWDRKVWGRVVMSACVCFSVHGWVCVCACECV